MALTPVTICSGVTVSPCPNDTFAKPMSPHLSTGRMTPARSPGNPTPVGRPNPKRASASASPSRPSRRAIFVAPMLLENLKTSATVSTPCGCVSWIEYLPTIILPCRQSKRSSARTTPASSADAIVNVFIVEPGSYASAMARSRAPAASDGSLGLNVGADAIASSSPVCGFMTIATMSLACVRACPSAMARSVTKVR